MPPIIIRCHDLHDSLALTESKYVNVMQFLIQKQFNTFLFFKWWYKVSLWMFIVKSQHMWQMSVYEVFEIVRSGGYLILYFFLQKPSSYGKIIKESPNIEMFTKCYFGQWVHYFLGQICQTYFIRVSTTQLILSDLWCGTLDFW